MSKYVLVVDDNPSDSLMTSACVEAQGFMPIAVKDGFDALDKITSSDFDFRLLIVDLQMPNMGGVELIRRIKKISRYQKIPILVTSARREARDIKQVLTLGANDYLVKPLDVQVFEEKFMRIVGHVDEWRECEIDQDLEESNIYIKTSLKILSLSEVGLTVFSSDPLDEGRAIDIEGSLFGDVDIKFLTAKLRGFSIKTEEGYESKLSFIGLTESDRKKIRMICQSRWNQNNLNKIYNKGGLK